MNTLYDLSEQYKAFLDMIENEDDFDVTAQQSNQR